MGRVLVDLKVSNSVDILTRKKRARSLILKEALVDTGAAMLALHDSEIKALGLSFLRKIKVRTANGPADRRVFGIARVEIAGREGDFDVVEISDDMPVLLGYVVLEQLDLSVDPSKNRVVTNPEHGKDYTLDLF